MIANTTQLSASQHKHALAWSKWMIQPKFPCPFILTPAHNAEVKVVCWSSPCLWGECTSVHSTSLSPSHKCGRHVASSQLHSHTNVLLQCSQWFIHKSRPLVVMEWTWLNPFFPVVFWCLSVCRHVLIFDIYNYTTVAGNHTSSWIKHYEQLQNIITRQSFKVFVNVSTHAMFDKGSKNHYLLRIFFWMVIALDCDQSFIWFKFKM